MTSFLVFLILSLPALSLADRALEKRVKRQFYRIEQKLILDDGLSDLSKSELRQVSEKMQSILDVADGGSEQQKLICAPAGGGWYHVTKLNTGEKIGSSVSKKRCSQAISNVNQGVFCSPESGNWYHLTRISDLQVISDDTTNFDRCISSLNQINNGLICSPTGGGWFSVFYLRMSKKVSSSTVDFEKCKQILQRSTEGFVCAPVGGSSYQLLNLSSWQKIGASTSFNECVANIPN